MDKIATATFLAKMIQDKKVTYAEVLKKYPDLQQLIDTIGQEKNYDFHNK